MSPAEQLRRVAAPLTNAIKQDLSCMEQLGVITPVLEPTTLLWHGGGSEA